MQKEKTELMDTDELLHHISRSAEGTLCPGGSEDYEEEKCCCSSLFWTRFDKVYQQIIKSQCTLVVPFIEIAAKPSDSFCFY